MIKFVHVQPSLTLVYFKQQRVGLKLKVMIVFSLHLKESLQLVYLKLSLAQRSTLALNTV